MAGIGIGVGYGLGRGIHYDPIAKAYFNAVPNAFSNARKVIINTLIAGLRSDGNLTKLDRLWLFANTTTGNAVIDLIGLNSVTLVNSPTFTADQGYQGNGSTMYINTNYSLSSNSVNLTLNSASAGFYNRENSLVSGSIVEFGCSNATFDGIISLSRFTGNLFLGRANSATNESVANSDARGFFSMVRTASNSQSIWKNGSSVASSSTTSTSLVNLNVYALAYNNNGAASGFCTRQMSVVFMGSGTINQAALYTRIQTYMTSLGTQV